MKTTSLILLVDCPPAQRMAAAWPILPSHPSRPSRAFFTRWAQISRVRAGNPQDIGEALIAHGICLPDGTLDPNAERFLRAEIARHLPKGKQKGKDHETGKPEDR